MSGKKIQDVMFFDNGCVAVFDQEGQQISELQVGLPELWALHAESLGYDPKGVKICMPCSAQAELFKVGHGYNWKFTS